ncbi:hypothetical protein [Cyclobacterium jeungdonense]|uniref:Pectate lyase n=1 Tax=Cyclobacterium jeungdonense TaxID=708087 RepID=A0ABT8CET0_9BACT|nr:hypothetical protein [Cyclobacterium jeungdonense]MDN3690464.1 hypothetical protein [Cyclobacterium jeungdonense]
MNMIKRTIDLKRVYILLMGMLTVSFYASASGFEREKDRLLEIVKAYADAMIEKGRDSYGDAHSPLFAAALDRSGMNLGSAESFGKISGVRDSDRSLGGANPQEHRSLYAILYQLTSLTGEEKYAEEADQALKYFFTNCQSPETGLMAWGEHLYWDFRSESCGGIDIHEINGEWPFWDQCYEMAPEASWRFALGLWDNQIDSKKTGDFSRHARWSTRETYQGFEFPRYAGQMILTWTDAYVRTDNLQKKRRSDLTKAISTVLGRMEANMKIAESGYLIAGRAEQGDHINVVWLNNNLEMARCLWKAADQIAGVDKQLAGRMENLAMKQDLDFHRTKHPIIEGGGFTVTLDAKTGEPRQRDMNNPYTAVWATGYGYSTHSDLANLLFARYQQLKQSHPQLADQYKKLIISSAEQYLLASPEQDQLQKPDAFANVVKHMINSYELTGEEKFLRRAEYFAQIGIDLFLTDGNPLPMATNQHDHYEAITGGPEFMYALLQLATQY